MKKLFVLSLLGLLYSCNQNKQSLIDGSWSWITNNNERIYIYTFDDGWTGFCVEFKGGASNGGSTMFGDLSFLSDSTAIMHFKDKNGSFDTNIWFKRFEGTNDLAVCIDELEGIWIQRSSPLDYKSKDFEHEKAIRAAIYVKKVEFQKHK